MLFSCLLNRREREGIALHSSIFLWLASLSPPPSSVHLAGASACALCPAGKYYGSTGARAAKEREIEMGVNVRQTEIVIESGGESELERYIGGCSE
jgi:hypothetical protein